MPVISVSRNALFERLGKKYSEDEFYDLCFEFGIELDDVEEIEGDKTDVTYKIEIGANRYDLLCLEGLSRALRLFIGAEKKLPKYNVVTPAQPLKMIADNSVNAVRPIVVCAVLRNITFTEQNYKSFIDLQDKLHQNICRKRTLVSIGTHDLDTISGPFTYMALPPEEIVFVPLNDTVSMNAKELMVYLSKDSHLSKYLHIIKDKPTYPVIYDSNKVVLSLPPIINGDHSKIKLETKNVFIEVTAVDRTKALTVLDTMVTMFGEYTSTLFEVEQVEVVETSGVSHFTPDFTPRVVEAPLSYLDSAIGVKISKDKVVDYLLRMGVPATIVDSPAGPVVSVPVPPTRSDILHACDVLEDVAIGYGFNKILDIADPPKTLTVGAQQPLNKLTDALRNELAQAGYTEVLTLSLCSTEENYNFLRQPNDNLAVKIANPKTIEYQVGRTNLYVGLLKTLNKNKEVSLPIKIFEISDVMLKSDLYDVGARNKRYLCAMYTNLTSAFEIIHGLLERVMMLLEIPKTPLGGTGYTIVAGDDPTYFPGRCAKVIYKGNTVGHFGSLHPEVLENFHIQFPASALHLDIEPFL